MSLTHWLSLKFSRSTASQLGEPRTPAPSGSSGRRKAERVERREQLYGVVRAAMMRAGVLSSSYRFKVLSLDARGGRYLVMVDLTSVAAEESGRLSEIETLVALNAKTRFDIHVSGVYWRLSDYVTTGLTSRTSAQAAQKQSASLDPTEILAFKGAFAAATGGAAGLFASGEAVSYTHLTLPTM
jgi:hypothetical protein